VRWTPLFGLTLMFVVCCQIPDAIPVFAWLGTALVVGMFLFREREKMRTMAVRLWRLASATLRYGGVFALGFLANLAMALYASKGNGRAKLAAGLDSGAGELDG
jgi:hypothetical protein